MGKMSHQLSRGFYLCCALATMMLFGTQLQANAQASEPSQGLTFDLPFDGNLKSTFGAQPDVASQKGTPSFVPGKNGQALREGAKDNYLLYRADGNVRGDAGTVSVWIRPQWKRTIRIFMFSGICTPTGVLFYIARMAKNSCFFSAAKD
jgi:hypothetical protein